jgi:pyruvate dehydrogenase complex dehydrogenase (E1) component
VAEAASSSGCWRGCGGVRDGRQLPPGDIFRLGAVAGNTIVPLGVDRFGQSGDIPDLYRAYGIDSDAILAAAARACLTALR